MRARVGVKGESEGEVRLRVDEDTYLPAFEAGVTKGKASGIMCTCVRG